MNHTCQVYTSHPKIRNTEPSAEQSSSQIEAEKLSEVL